MSTTVSYKGQTLATVSNQTKTLLTEGKYLEDDLTLVDVSGGGSTLITKNISANGTYNASSDSADGYSQVTVAVPNTYTAGDEGKVVSSGALVSQTSKNINSNGTHSTVTNNQVVVAVPNSYSAGDEGKVVSNGALVAQTAHADVTPTTSDQTIDTTTNNSIKVKGDADLIATNIKKDVEIFGVTGSYEGGGGEDVFALVADRTITSIESDFTTLNASRLLESCTSLTSVRFPNWESGAGGYICNNCSALTSVYVPKLETMQTSNFSNCTSLRVVVLPSFTHYSNNANFEGCTALEIVDYAAETIDTWSFFSQREHRNNAALNTIIIRATNDVAKLGNLNNLTGTPFDDGGTGGTLYVPNDLISSYQSASNWSTILGYANNQIKSIESTHTDPTAPIDLTLYYADGTLIPT